MVFPQQDYFTLNGFYRSLILPSLVLNYALINISFQTQFLYQSSPCCEYVRLVAATSHSDSYCPFHSEESVTLHSYFNIIRIRFPMLPFSLFSIVCFETGFYLSSQYLTLTSIQQCTPYVNFMQLIHKMFNPDNVTKITFSFLSMSVLDVGI